MEYNKGDIWITNPGNVLYAHIVKSINDIGVFTKCYHFSGSLVNDNDFTTFDCFERCHRKVTTIEFEEAIRDWKTRETERYNELMNDLTNFKNIVLSDND